MSLQLKYENPPLIEVIAEIRWPLKSTSPTHNFDPYFDDFSKAIIQALAEAGYAHVEELIPPQVPLEFLGSVPTHRIRQASGSWPIYQIGPGLFTVNHVPPYDGWSHFQGILWDGIKLLIGTYPKNYLKLEKLELRYLNGFDKTFGYVDEDFRNFIREHLGIEYKFNEKIENSAISIKSLLQFQLEMDSPEESTGAIRIAPGFKNNEPALVVDLLIQKIFSEKIEREPDEVMGWFEAAHDELRAWFISMASPDLKKVMKQIGEKSQ